MSKLLSGVAIREEICNELKPRIEKLKFKNIIPTLVIIQVGNNEASNAYIRNKIKLSEKLNTKTILKKLSDEIEEKELLDIIEELNNDKNINGIIVQLPLPNKISENKIIESISPEKDVDCFHNINVGKLWTAKKNNVLIQPCTPCGVIEMLKRSNIAIAGKNVVIIGRSNIVGKPLAALFLLEDATVTICHSKTNNLKQVCKSADILVCAIGKAKFINEEYVNENQVVVDVGMNVDENKKLCGDVDFEKVKNIVSYISPVPGGVGPMTVMILMKNLIVVSEKQNGF